jgi:hypothetical protein
VKNSEKSDGYPSSSVRKAVGLKVFPVVTLGGLDSIVLKAAFGA